MLRGSFKIPRLLNLCLPCLCIGCSCAFSQTVWNYHPGLLSFIVLSRSYQNCSISILVCCHVAIFSAFQAHVDENLLACRYETVSFQQLDVFLTNFLMSSFISRCILICNNVCKKKLRCSLCVNCGDLFAFCGLSFLYDIILGASTMS